MHHPPGSGVPCRLGAGPPICLSPGGWGSRSSGEPHSPSAGRDLRGLPRPSPCFLKRQGGPKKGGAGSTLPRELVVKPGPGPRAPDPSSREGEMTGNIKSQNRWPEVDPQMDRLLGPQHGLRPVPAEPACSPPTPGWWDWGSGDWAMGRPSALDGTALFSRKVTKSRVAASRGKGTAARSTGQSGFPQPPGGAGVFASAPE